MDEKISEHGINLHIRIKDHPILVSKDYKIYR